jgi:integrase
MRGQGRVYKRGGLYWIQFNREGRCYREPTRSASIQTAREMLKQRIAQITFGTFAPLAEKQTVSELMERVFDDYELHNRSTLDDAKTRWKLHLAPVFGHRRAANVDEDAVRDYMLGRKSAGAKTATINREIALLKRAFRLGKLRLDVSKLNEDNVRTGFITETQAVLLAEECAKVGLWMRALFAVLFEFGFRVGEALALRVSQIDLARRTIRLNPGETKSGQGREAVMTKATHSLVQLCCASKSSNDYVFSRGDKRIRDFRGVWQRVILAAGFPKLHVHDLRRSAIKRMIQRGIPQHVAMQISGHRTISVFHRYAIVSHADLADAARKLESNSTIETQFADEQKPDAVN